MGVKMSVDDVEARLLAWVGSEIYDASVGIEVDTNLIEGGLDSFSLLRILVFIEKTFGLRISEAEINEERMRSIESMSRLIYELLESR